MTASSTSFKNPNGKRIVFLDMEGIMATTTIGSVAFRTDKRAAIFRNGYITGKALADRNQQINAASGCKIVKL
jgi:hypothetical protein